jgi:hypothetical protein
MVFIYWCQKKTCKECCYVFFTLNKNLSYLQWDTSQITLVTI